MDGTIIDPAPDTGPKGDGIVVPIGTLPPGPGDSLRDTTAVDRPDPSDPPETDAQPVSGSEYGGINGQIASISLDKDGHPVVFLVESQARTGYDQAWVEVTQRTSIFQQSGEVLERITSGDVKVGDTVEALFYGPVRESYPVQAAALEIQIVAD